MSNAKTSMTFTNPPSSDGSGFVVHEIIILMERKPQYKFRNLTAVRIFSILCVVFGVLSIGIQVRKIFIFKVYYATIKVDITPFIHLILMILWILFCFPIKGIYFDCI